LGRTFGHVVRRWVDWCLRQIIDFILLWVDLERRTTTLPGCRRGGGDRTDPAAGDLRGAFIVSPQFRPFPLIYLFRSCVGCNVGCDPEDSRQTVVNHIPQPFRCSVCSLVRRLVPAIDHGIIIDFTASWLDFEMQHDYVTRLQAWGWGSH
jgi:hypothetical protein